MRLFAVVVGAMGVLGTVGGSARAQVPQFAAADSLAGSGDSLAALRALDVAVRVDVRDAEAWHRRGMLAWRMSNAEKRVGFMKREANDSLLELADSSLHIATKIAPTPDNLIDLGRFDLTSNSAGTRGKAKDLFERALKLARKNGDSAGISRASDEMGMTWWRRYEDRADRHIYSYIIQNVKDRTFVRDPRSIAYFVDRQAIRAASQDWSGQREYLHAQEFFADAIRADPANTHALWHLYMLLADRQRWVELQHAARVRLTTEPADAFAWLAYGLASHRLNDDHTAEEAFDSAMTYLPAHDRRRYDDIARIVTPRDSLNRLRLPDGERAMDERMYWLMADPLWSTPDNEHRLEFLSRMVYAELRFSVEEFAIHGADTDRGDVYVRYGPPPAVISFPADPTKSGEHRIRTLWWYNTDEAFLFRQLPTYGVSTLDPDDARELRRLRDTVPVVWANAGDRRYTDSVGVQLARFRSGARDDSADVFVCAEVPVHDMVRGIDLARGALDITFDAYTWRAKPVYQHAIHETIDFARPDRSQIRAWRTRMHAGTFLYRVEALQPDAGRGARAASRIEIAADDGFGLSDLLVADQVTPRPGTGGERWSDFLISPNVARVKRGQPFALLWETYALAPQPDGTEKYRVAINVHRVKSSGGLGGLAAKVIGGVASAIGLTGRGDDHVSLSFLRQVPARPVSVDYVTLDMGNAPPGRYRLSVDVTDLANGQRVSSESSLTIVE